MEQQRVIRSLSFIIAALIGLTSWQGLVSPDIYAKETEHWAAQAMCQDMLNVCIIPAYLLFTMLVGRKRNRFSLVWAGITVYFIYTFFIYCFDVHFNRLFLFYTLILGLTIYSLVFFLYSNRKNFHAPKTDSLLNLFTGGYFILTAVFFYLLWLSEILLDNLFRVVSDNPDQLPTNPVHVLDLAIVLPGFIIGGILLARNKKLGNLLAPVLLTFSFLMEVTIGMLILYSWEHNQENHPEIALFFFGLAFISLALVATTVKNNHKAHEQ